MTQLKRAVAAACLAGALSVAGRAHGQAPGAAMKPGGAPPGPARPSQPSPTPPAGPPAAEKPAPPPGEVQKPAPPPGEVQKPAPPPGEVQKPAPPPAAPPLAAVPSSGRLDLLSLNIQAVHTDWFLDRWLAALLLPKWMRQDDWPVMVEVPDDAKAGARELAADPMIRGQKTGLILTGGSAQGGVGSPGTNLVVDGPVLAAGQRLARVDVRIRPETILPDQYAGEIRLHSPLFGNPGRGVSIPFTLSVRSGPLWPLLAILAGIVIGRLAQGMATPAAQMQIKLLPRLYQLRTTANQVESPGSYQVLSDELDRLRDRIEAGTEPEPILAQHLDGLEKKIRSLLALQALERRINAASLDVDLKQELARLVVDARRALIEGNPDLAQQLQTQISGRLANALDTGTRGAVAADAAIDGIQELAEEVSARAQAAPAPPRTPPREPGPLSKVVDVLAMLAGSVPISAGSRVRVIQPLLFLVLLALLILQGFKSFYIDVGGASFGSGGLYDNIPLFLWGLSVDVAQRTLQQVAGKAG